MGTAVIGYLFFNSVKEFVLKIVYQGGEFTRYNDVSGQTEKLANLLSLSGIKRIFCMCLGRLFYLGTSTVLLLYIGVFICLFYIIICAFLKRGNRGDGMNDRIKDMICFSYWPILFFLLLSLAFSIGISALYFQDPGEYVSFVFYGRYTEYMIGPFLIIALLALHNETRQCRCFYVLSVITQLLLCVQVYFYLEQNGISRSSIHPNAVGVAGILTNLGSSSIEYATFGIGLIAVLTASGVFYMLRFCKRENRELKLTGYLLVVVLLVFFWSYHTYSYINSSLHSDKTVDKQEQYLSIAEELAEIEENEAVVFLFDGILNGAGMVDMTYLQFKIPDVTINMVSVLDSDAEEEIAEADYLLWSASVTYPETLEEIRDSCFEILLKNDYLTLYRRCDSLSGAE